MRMRRGRFRQSDAGWCVQRIGNFPNHIDLQRSLVFLSCSKATVKDKSGADIFNPPFKDKHEQVDYIIGDERERETFRNQVDRLV